MKSILFVLIMGCSSFAFSSFSDIDLVVREALDKEYNDGETCPDFYEDYFDFMTLKTDSDPCFMEIVARVRLKSCFNPSKDSPVVEALVCVYKDESSYRAEYLYDWRP